MSYCRREHHFYSLSSTYISVFFFSVLLLLSSSFEIMYRIARSEILDSMIIVCAHQRLEMIQMQMESRKFFSVVGARLFFLLFEKFFLSFFPFVIMV